MAKQIDAMGKPCPMPVILAKKEIDAGEEQFTILVDNTTAVENLQRLADSQGYRTTAQGKQGAYQVTFCRSPQSETSQPECPACEALISQPKSGSWAVFIPRETLGDGDPELGGSLMKMFFYTLAQSEDLPRWVIFMNGGVRLPAGEEQVCEHLRTLVEKGVEVLVCGTCLNFYGLTDQLQVGTVSNMYDIVERLRQADKVITL